MDRKYLFLFGVARSGTTALALIANAHPAIAVGMERFLKLGKTGALSPEHFTTEAFFDLPAGHERRLNKSDRFRERFDEARVVGDKIPHLTDGLAAIEERFPAPHFVAIVRDPAEVAHSWYRQAVAPKGAWAGWMSDTTSVTAQATFWKAALTEAPPERVLLVSYKAMLRDAETMRELVSRIAAFVGIDDGCKRQRIAALARKSEKVRDRERTLDPSAAAFIRDNYYRPALDFLDARGTATIADFPAELREATLGFYAARPTLELDALDSLAARGLGGPKLPARRAKLLVATDRGADTEAALLDAIAHEPAKKSLVHALAAHAKRVTGEKRANHALAKLARQRLQEGAREAATRILATIHIHDSKKAHLIAAVERLRSLAAKDRGDPKPRNAKAGTAKNPSGPKAGTAKARGAREGAARRRNRVKKTGKGSASATASPAATE